MTEAQGLISRRFGRVGPARGHEDVVRAVAIEQPIAIEINGLGYAVMMATPADLVDFAWGFLTSERLIEGAADVLDIDLHPHASGTLLRVTVSSLCIPAVVERIRHRVSESSCGLCGIENLEQALRPLPCRAQAAPPPSAAVFSALNELGEHQPLNAATGAVHAAARCAAGGRVICVREDVGRHNAFDKLIGAQIRAGEPWGDGFALLTSRCSYELVEKAALAGCRTLVTISAPTSLAVERAEQAGINLIALARRDSYLVASR